MAAILSSAPNHVPAWKKLGLRLKNTKKPQESAPQIGSTSHDLRQSHKRKLLAQVEAFARVAATEEPLQKKKKTKSTLQDSESTTSVTLSADSTDLPPQIHPPTLLTKRKSVTFAPDAKSQDGDSVKQIYKNWLNSQRASNQSFDDSRLNPALKLVTPATTETNVENPAAALTDTSPTVDGKPISPRKKAKKKKKKIKLKSKPDPFTSENPLLTPAPSHDTTHSYTHPALTYLTTHCNHPNAWKFNKAHQNYLIKHLFRLAHIPSSYDLALASYLKGLASENTRRRIQREALEIRKEDEKWLASDLSSSSSEKREREKIKDNEDEAKDVSEDTEMGIERETSRQSLARRLQDYNAAVDRIRQILETAEDHREAAEWNAGPGRGEWEARLLQRQRAEVVLWGVGEVGEQVMAALQTAAAEKGDIVQGGGKALNEQPQFRRQMGPKRIRFTDENPYGSVITTTTTAASTMQSNDQRNVNNAIKEATATAAAPADAKKKKKRKRMDKNRQGAIPDDMTSSSSSDGEQSEDEEAMRAILRKREFRERLAAQRRELERARWEVEEELSSSDDDDGDESKVEKARENENESEDETSSSGSGSDDGDESD